MKSAFLHIVQLMLWLPVIVWGQLDDGMTPPNFYLELGIKDASHELLFASSNQEDEQDFWLDQKAYEKLLKEKSQRAYQSYINGKHLIYRQHQIHCGSRCAHSQEFERQMAFYLINGNSLADDEVVYTIKKK